MAQPVTGWLGYDPASDRPLVKLVAGTKKLLTEDDSAGGGGGAHGPTHENGGADEINVGGLSGVLADNQVAGSLDTTGSPVNVDAAAPPTAGKVLTALDATHATWQAPASSELLPNSGHADNEEFNGTADTLPTGWGFYSDSAGGNQIFSAAACILASGTPTVGIDPYTLSSPSGNSTTPIQYNVNSRRQSWFFHKVPSEGVGVRRWICGRRHTSDLPSDFIVMARFMMHAKIATGGENINGEFGFGVYGEAASIILPGAVVGGAGITTRVRPSTISTQFEATMTASTGTTTTTVTRNFGNVSGAYALPEYLKVVRRAGALYGFLGWSAGSWSLIGAPITGAAAAGTYRWWGLSTISRNDGSDHLPYPYIGVDWVRRYDGTNDVL